VLAAVTLATAGVLVSPAGIAVAHEGDAGALQVSGSAGRAPSSSLSGASVKGSVYAFLPTEPDVSSVQFWLDNCSTPGDPTLFGGDKNAGRDRPFRGSGSRRRQQDRRGPRRADPGDGRHQSW
jgi:hypothetical protein